MSTKSLENRVQAVRAFNRFYTRHIGALGDEHLQSAYALTEVRVLYELGHNEPAYATDLRRTLGLDASYLSRILARFEADRLITKERAPDDGRRQRLRLTTAGRARVATLNNRAAGAVRESLHHLAEVDQDRLLAALDTVHDLLSSSERERTIRLRSVRPGELGWVVQRHGALYHEEYGWDQTFEGLVASIVGAYATSHTSRENAWIAELDGEPVGFIMCVADDEWTAKLRLLFVEPSARGFGIGSRLVDECVRFAKAKAYDRMVLWTNHPLAAARRIYDAKGFELVSEERHHSFGHDLIGQSMALDLDRQ